jgi:PAS domain S-box-containing protein/putative nucleotidyltransferase with HDIG domain
MSEKTVTKKEMADELARLRQREKRYRNLIEESRDAFIITKYDGTFVDFNQAMVDIFGYSREEMMTMKAQQLYVDVNDRVRFQEEMEKHGTVRNYKMMFKKRDGKDISCLVTMTAIYQDGRVWGYNGIIHNITERKQAEELYSKLAHNSQAGVFVLQNSKFQFVNPYMRTHSGYTEEELLDMDPMDLVHPDDRETVRREAVRMLQGIRQFPYEHRTVRKDGSIIWVLENVTSIDYFGHRATLGNSMNITREREARIKLEEIETLESSILSAIPHAVIGLENRQIIFANDSVRDVFGWDPEEVIGKRTRIFYRSDEDFEEIGRRFYPVLENQETYSDEFPCRRKDGRDIICSVSSSRVGGTLREKRIVVVYEDVTERKAGEESLRESEEKYAAVVEQAMYGVVIIQNEVYTFVNRAMADITGHDVDELVGMPFLNIFTPAYRKVVMQRYKRRMSGRKVLPLYEAQVLCKDGTIKDVEIAFGIITINKQAADMGYIRDITARKRAEEELNKSFERIQRRLEETVNALASMTEKRDPYTAGHQQRVTQLARAIAEEMELPESQVEGTVVAATLHDIGKIYEPAEILSKPDILTEIEMLMMKVHPDVAYEILKNIDFPWPVARIVRQHHERYDGSGYPDGLKGEEILLEARIIAVADVVEAMASHRPYRSALGIEQALEEIINNRGILYDPKVVDACLQVFRERGFVFKMHPYTELRLRCSN